MKLARLVGIGWWYEYRGQLGWYDGTYWYPLNKELRRTQPSTPDQTWSNAHYELVGSTEILKVLKKYL